MSNKDLSRVAQLYGVDEGTVVRRQGDILEISLQNFKDLMNDVILEKIVHDPNLLHPEVFEKIRSLLQS